MFRSVAAAEKAALAGEGPDFDTQKCLDLQDEFLSSSPSNAPDRVFPFATNDNSCPPRTKVNGDADEGTVEQCLAANGDIVKSAEPCIESINPQPKPSPVLAAVGDDAASEIQTFVKKKTLRRNSDGHIRAFDEEGNEVPVCNHSELERAKQAAEAALETMDLDDLTQKSAMSLTQENPPSAYDQFDIQKHVREEYPSTATPDDIDAHENPRTQNQPSLHSKHPSTRTESTEHTYEENDPRYIQLNFEPSSIADAEDEDGLPQDPSFPPPQIEHTHSYEPQTPAPPMNPFNRKGSVLKPSQMFGATQPSSVGRRVSPTSSRPSPDVYNDFSSPPKRSRLRSSPLAARNEAECDPSPLQSSVRNLLARSNSTSTELPSAIKPRTSGVQSFDEGPRLQRFGATHEPRPYLSMKDSQERRNQFSQSDTDSDSDSSIDARPRKRLERERRIRQELSSISRMPTSSRPSSSSAVEVPSTGRRQTWQEHGQGTATTMRNTQEEAQSSLPGAAAFEVPSTGRRRSIQDEYVAQCEGRDARDTQQVTQDTQEGVKDTPPDDVVADSQALPDKEDPVEGGFSSNVVAPASGIPDEVDPGCSRIVSEGQANALHESTFPSYTTPIDQQIESRSEQDTMHGSAVIANPPEPPEPSLPLQELSMNQNNLRTPMTTKNQLFSDGPETVPETSPPERSIIERRSPQEERLRPMGEIANISFGADAVDDMAGLPGFTQDVEFENAMRLRSSPQPPPRIPARSVPSAQVSETIVVGPKHTMTVEVANPAMNPLSAEAQQTTPLVEEASCTDIQAQAGTFDRVGDMAAATEQQISSIEDQTVAPDGGKARATEGLHNATDNVPALASAKRTGLRTKSELKGPSRALRRSGSTSRSTTPSSGISKQVPKTKASASRSTKRSSAVLVSAPVVEASTSLPADEVANATPIDQPLAVSVPASSSTRSSKRKTTSADKQSTPAPLPKRTSKRKSGPTIVDDSVAPTRSSKRQSIARDAKEDSEDPLALPIPPVIVARLSPFATLFGNMAFAVSYQKREQEKDQVTKIIRENGGRILDDGFDTLFETSHPKELNAELTLSAANKPLGFSALIADEHSRKAKYMQALALGLPCISGQWILACVSKGAILDWSPYLLCAGQSSFLGNAMKSRVLPRYPATEANLETTLGARDKLLDGKSVLMITGRGKADKRKPYIFLTRALGPSRVGQVGDVSEAREKLGSETWDLLYADSPHQTAAAAVFGSGNSSSGSKKRKRELTGAADSTPSPKRIRVIDDETMIQSLILGQIMEV
ncbi:hypothetical protein N431DRAFT_421947 [Stipitochalara longipes BDJ]|nr:hypothetical protein N431DRAFT_421947 [Stipitochalara longipes BDJ]